MRDVLFLANRPIRGVLSFITHPPELLVVSHITLMSLVLSQILMLIGGHSTRRSPAVLRGGEKSHKAPASRWIQRSFLKTRKKYKC